MLGLSFGVGLAYVMCILSAILCVVWGLVNWNRGDEPVRNGDVERVKEDKKVKETL